MKLWGCGRWIVHLGFRSQSCAKPPLKLALCHRWLEGTRLAETFRKKKVLLDIHDNGTEKFLSL